MPDGYTYKSSGTNSQVYPPLRHHPFTSRPTTNTKPPTQGNHYCARDYGSGASNSNSYHYSNT
jgi:hypothetical protein